MKELMKIINPLSSGRKMIVGLLIIVAALVGKMYFDITDVQFNTAWMAGLGLAGVGGGHKVVKAMKPKGDQP